MRKVININRKWAFVKESEIPAAVPEKWNFVNLPHTWNAIDGQDGENDYYRGTCCYVKEISKDELPEADRYYLEFRGANSSASVYVGGKKLASHDGGYSTWRVDITENLESKTLIAVTVDNSPNETVYPQMADFTFYGGLYRDVNIIAVSNSHFDLDYYGGTGTVKWKSSNSKIAKVNKNGLVTALKKGKVTITATRNNRSVPCTVNVIQQKLTSSKLTVRAGKTADLDLKGAVSKVTWTSSKPKIASVNKNGLVKGLKKGTAVITAKHAGVSYKCTVTVK